MRVSLAPSHRQVACTAQASAAPLLNAGGACVILGQRALSMGAEATRLAGRKEVSDKGDNRWQPATRDSLCWPYSVAGCGATLVIADSGNNRVLLWQAAP